MTFEILLALTADVVLKYPAIIHLVEYAEGLKHGII
jgi:hypothetical protein